MRNYRITELQNYRNEMSTNHSVIQSFSDSVIQLFSDSVIRLFSDSVIRKSRQGFTLIELMVASILLGMLVIVLTMVFNQSSIAWRTGIAGVSELGETRRALGTFHEICDEILPGLGDKNVSGGESDNRTVTYRTVSVFNDSGDGLRPSGERTYDRIGSWGRAPSISSMADVIKGASKSIAGAGQGQSASLFVVGVRSAGPDQKFGTGDDITTWPEEVE